MKTIHLAIIATLAIWVVCCMTGYYRLAQLMGIQFALLALANLWRRRQA